MDILAFVAKLGVIQGELVEHRCKAIERSAEMIEKQAKDALGTYLFGWPELAESTLARKGADTPLLETGELRDSIEHSVEHRRLESEACIGTDSEIGLYHTTGTSKMPARPFMEPAAIAQAEEIDRLFGDAVKASFKP